MAALSRSVLAHPVWWGALLLLVVNDHLLKGSHVLPNAVTGKLSDFSGLIVAPLLLVEVVRPRSRGGRFACFALVGAVFATVNLSEAAAILFERLTSLAKVPWSICVDPTDLVAFIVYPIAWSLKPRAARRTFLRAGLLLGAVASAASGLDVKWFAHAALLNRNERPIRVRVRWPVAELDCKAIEGRSAKVFGPEVFGPGVVYEVEPFETVSLDRLDEEVLEPRSLTGSACDAVLVKVDGLPATVLFWSGLPTFEVPLSPGDADVEDLDFPTDGLLVVEPGEGRGLVLRPAGGGLELSSLAAASGEAECSTRGGDQVFGWSDLGGSLDTTLLDASVGADGCLALDLAGAPSGLFYLCVPAAELPFAPGDRVSIVSAESEEGRSLRMSRLGGEGALELFVWSGRATSIGLTTIDLECGGRRLECGSYVQPGALVLEDGSRVPRGAALEWVDADGRDVRMVVGRADRVIVGATACEPGRDAIGHTSDVLFIYREEN